MWKNIETEITSSLDLCFQSSSDNLRTCFINLSQQIIFFGCEKHFAAIKTFLFFFPLTSLPSPNISTKTCIVQTQHSRVCLIKAFNGGKVTSSTQSYCSCLPRRITSLIALYRKNSLSPWHAFSRDKILHMLKCPCVQCYRVTIPWEIIRSGISNHF